MKAFKKIAAFAVAMTMGCSVLAFAACNPENDSEENNDDNVTSNLPSGMPAQAVDATFVSALQEEKEYLSVNYTNKRSGTEINQTKTNGVLTDTETTTYEINVTASGKVDVTNGDADFVAKSVADYESTNKDKDFTSRLEYDNYTEYDFLRSWNMFSYKSDKEVEDFTNLELSYDGSANINWEEILGQFGSIGGGSGVASAYAEEASAPAFDLSMLPQTGDLVKLSLASENAVLVNLAAAANTLKHENGVYSIDLIETVDTVIKEVGTVVAALKGTNTVGDILNNDIIKKYFSVVTELVPVETVKASVDAAIDGLSTIENQYVEGLLLYIQQDLNALKTIEASTTYDYIVSLVSSQSLVNIANTVFMLMGATPTASAPSDDATPAGFFTKTLDKYTVNEIISLVNETSSTYPVTLQFLQNSYAEYVESVCDGEKLVTGSDSAITELSVEYKVENGKLVSQKVSYAFDNKTSYEDDVYTYYPDGNDEGITISHSSFKEEKQEGVIEITYDTSAPVIKDINGNTVNYSEYEWDEEELNMVSVWDYSTQNPTRVDFYVGAIVVDGEYAGFKLYNENNEVVGQNATSIVFQVGGISYVIHESSRYSGSQKSIYYDVETEGYGVIDYAYLSQKEVERTSTVAAIIAANAL